jgi:hypothetical protein
MIGSDSAMTFDSSELSSLLGTPVAAADFATAPDDPKLDGAAWASAIMSDDWKTDGAVDAFVGAGPMITDDHPLSEYFLIRTLTATDHSGVNDARLRGL